MTDEDKDKPDTETASTAATPAKKKTSKKKTAAKKTASKKTASKKTAGKKSADTEAGTAGATASAASSSGETKREELNEKLHAMGVMPDSKQPAKPAGVPLSGMILGAVIILVIIVLSLYVWYERRDATQQTAQQTAPMYSGMAGPPGNAGAGHPMMQPGPWGPYANRSPAMEVSQPTTGTQDVETTESASQDSSTAAGSESARPGWATQPPVPPRRPDWANRPEPPQRPDWATRPPAWEPPEQPDWVQKRRSMQPPVRPDWANRPPVWEPPQRPDWVDNRPEWAPRPLPSENQGRAENQETPDQTLPQPPYRGWVYRGYRPYYGPVWYPPYPRYW